MRVRTRKGARGRRNGSAMSHCICYYYYYYYYYYWVEGIRGWEKRD
jgi:hypothetical protein